jgi:hypothetical protein
MVSHYPASKIKMGAEILEYSTPYITFSTHINFKSWEIKPKKAILTQRKMNAFGLRDTPYYPRLL